MTFDLSDMNSEEVRMPPHEVHDPVMRPPEAVLPEDRVGLRGEIAVGEKQQLDPLPHQLLAWAARIACRAGQRLHPPCFIYVSHVDLFRNLRYSEASFAI